MSKNQNRGAPANAEKVAFLNLRAIRKMKIAVIVTTYAADVEAMLLKDCIGHGSESENSDSSHTSHLSDSV